MFLYVLFFNTRFLEVRFLEEYFCRLACYLAAVTVMLYNKSPRTRWQTPGTSLPRGNWDLVALGRGGRAAAPELQVGGLGSATSAFVLGAQLTGQRPSGPVLPMHNTGARESSPPRPARTYKASVPSHLLNRIGLASARHRSNPTPVGEGRGVKWMFAEWQSKVSQVVIGVSRKYMFCGHISQVVNLLRWKKTHQGPLQ